MSTDTSTKTRNGVSRNEVSKSNRCFVVLPYDKHGTDFYETYARPACERAGFSAERADQQLCHDIAEGIVTSLGIAPMVIAYLGSPPWNENVILELGYRLATRLPMVIMCDEQPDHSNFTLPFQLTTMRVEKVPACEDVEETLRDEIVARTAEIMRAEARRSTTLACNQAIAVIHAPAGAFSGREAVYANASSRAMQLFGADGQLVGRTLEQFVEDRKNDMPDYQFKTFCWEQERLAQNPSPDTSVIATTPIVFATGATGVPRSLSITEEPFYAATVQDNDLSVSRYG